MKKVLVFMISVVLLGSCRKKGCTDPYAVNYDYDATEADGSCILIGDTYQGGIVFYVDGNGGGLIAAPTDQATTAVIWGCSGTIITGADGTTIGTGNQNTIDIVTDCTFDSGYAAQICYNLNLGGYDDWYLPSKDELNVMYLNKSIISGFSIDRYWSSSQINNYNAIVQSFNNGGQGGLFKSEYANVRAIRAF
jgi:hypothetical protein